MTQNTALVKCVRKLTFLNVILKKLRLAEKLRLADVLLGAPWFEK